MSDRRRRWICQFVFMAVCVLPTAWVLLRLVYQPGPESYAQQLQLQLGVPVVIDQVSTPTPNLTWLHHVRIQHPETGSWAIADRLAIMYGGWDSTRPRWQIEQLVLREETMPDFFAQLHHTVIRQRLHFNSERSAVRANSFPIVHVRNLVVMPGEIGMAAETIAEPRPVAKLKDVMVEWRVDSAGGGPRLEVAAKLMPLRGESNPLKIGSPESEVPIMCSLERQPIIGPSGHHSEYVTRWEVAVLERALPISWLNFASWPDFVRRRPELEFSGWLGGTLRSDRWQLTCRQAKVRGWDLSDLEFLASGQRSLNEAPLNLNVREVTWSGSTGGMPQWDTCDVELSAGMGVLDLRWLQSARMALGLNVENRSVQPASFHEDQTSATVRFDELNLGVRLRDGYWWFRPLESDARNLPILEGRNQQEQVMWPLRDERVWNSQLVNHETARVEFVDSEQSSDAYQRAAIEIAPIEFSWRPSEFIQGIPQVVSLDPQIHDSRSIGPNPMRWQLRKLLEEPHPATATDDTDEATNASSIEGVNENRRQEERSPF